MSDAKPPLSYVVCQLQLVTSLEEAFRAGDWKAVDSLWSMALPATLRNALNRICLLGDLAGLNYGLDKMGKAADQGAGDLVCTAALRGHDEMLTMLLHRQFPADELVKPLEVLVQRIGNREYRLTVHHQACLDALAKAQPAVIDDNGWQRLLEAAAHYRHDWMIAWWLDTFPDLIPTPLTLAYVAEHDNDKWVNAFLQRGTPLTDGMHMAHGMGLIQGLDRLGMEPDVDIALLRTIVQRQGGTSLLPRIESRLLAHGLAATLPASCSLNRSRSRL